MGQRLGHYEIAEKLGEGGMGAVYRAHDAILGRDVAIKILPDGLAEDPERQARFEREARLLAALNHPHIATIYGHEQDQGRHFLVLELIEGDTLAERLRHGALPVAEAIPLAIQITRGLEAAHGAGIVHRDLKPANVKITPDGEIKILDFGLAKPVETAPASDLESPTLTYAPTSAGVLLGTAAYMSPEQVRGQAVDKRADIWAFGVVLWEMLTGRKLFRGETTSDVLAATLTRQVDWGKLPAGLPPAIHRVLRRCLVQDPRQRLHDIADARIDLEEALEAPAPVAGEPATPYPLWRRALPWALAVLGLLAGWLLKPAREPEPPWIIRSEIALPDGERLASSYQHGFAMSPDNERIAFVSGTMNGLQPATSRIYLRRLDSWQEVPVPQTEASGLPFFSPDGDWLGFFSLTPDFRARLCKTPIAGGEISTIAILDQAVGASWGGDDTIVIGSYQGGLQRLAAVGGEPEPLTELDQATGEYSHRLPHFLPGGRSVLYTALKGSHVGDAAVFVHSLATGRRRQLVEDAMDARYVESGHLVFARRGQLFAVAFDVDEEEIRGAPVRVAEAVSHSLLVGGGLQDTGAAQFSVSRSGTLALARGSVAPERKRSLVTVDRQGRESRLDAEEKHYLGARVSPDGRFVLANTNYPPWAIWLFDTERGSLTRQTFSPAAPESTIWGPGPGQFTYQITQGREHFVYVKTLGSGPGQGEILAREFDGHPSSWSPDGETLLAVAYSLETAADIWLVRRSGEAEPLLQTEYWEQFPEFSPDGKWFVYTSDESGREEVYVRPFPGPGPAVQVSVTGGSSPAWSRSGTEVFFTAVGPPNGFFSVAVRAAGEGLLPARPIELFRRPVWRSNPIRQGDVTPDGRFLAVSAPADGVIAATLDALMPSRISLVHNWHEELSRRVPPHR